MCNQAVPDNRSSTVIELRVRNHPGTMSHITGLFARRAFNLEAILCVPDTPTTPESGPTSTILLVVEGGARLVQLERQLERLHDVLTVRHRTEISAELFGRLLSTANTGRV